jgi:hypothetical protein
MYPERLEYVQLLTEKNNYIDVFEKFLYLERNKFEYRLLLSGSNDMLIYHIDTFVQHREYIEIMGWAFIKGESSTNNKIFIILKADKNHYIFKTYPIKRTDVAKHFNSMNYEQSGFSVSIPNVVLKNNTYEIGVRVQNNHIGAFKFTDKHIRLEHWKDASIPEIEPSDIFPEYVPIRILEQKSISGNVSEDELKVINKMIAFFKPEMVFEIGTFDGRTSLNMACNTPQEAIIYTLDLPREKKGSVKLPLDLREEIYINKRESGLRYKETPYEKKIVQLYGDSAAFDFLSFCGKMDFVFIDGSHAYEYVLNDTEKALKLLKSEKGILLWHDYGVWEGVTKALNELFIHNDYFVSLKHIKGTSLVFLKK